MRVAACLASQLERVEDGFRHDVGRRARRASRVDCAAAEIREVVLREADAKPPRWIRVAERPASADVPERLRRGERSRVPPEPVAERAARANPVDLVPLEALQLDPGADPRLG